MTPTPEDTAFVAIQFWCDDPEGTDEDLRAIISQAIREAEDAAYERAAVTAEDLAGSTESMFHASEAIRDLKSPKEV